MHGFVRRRLAMILVLPIAAASCSSCDEGKGKPAASAAPTTSYSSPLPSVSLTPAVKSTEIGAWPEQTKALTTGQIDALLPLREGARVQVTDAGLEPRAVRRHQLEVGQSQELLLELDMGMKITQDGATTLPPVPALEVKAKLTTAESEGDVGRVEIEVVAAEIRSRGDADADVVEQIGPYVKRLHGLRASLQVTAQGVHGNAPVPPASTPTEVWQLWTTIGEAVTDALVIFPAEPIGAGAKWVVLDRQQRAGVAMLRKTEWALLDVTDGELRLRGALVEAAIAGTARDPALPKEVHLDVLEGVAVGKRRHALRAGDLWPLASLTELSSDLTLRATATDGKFTDTRTSEVALTQILRSVRADVADAGVRLPGAAKEDDTP
jgi:hypothetical protein